jgi:hypothetical protein
MNQEMDTCNALQVGYFLWSFIVRNASDIGRLERILTMVYVVQNYWVYFGLYPSSGN